MNTSTENDTYSMLCHYKQLGIMSGNYVSCSLGMGVAYQIAGTIITLLSNCKSIWGGEADNDPHNSELRLATNTLVKFSFANV